MPSGIPYIIGNEAAERFSYYGMKGILTIFMVEYLKMSENTSNVWFHNFGSAVYLFPLVGALLSDFVLGKYRTILWLSLVYCVGHLVLAIYETQNGLYWGLTLIAIGAGGIKPCVSAHVGDQFDERNKHLIEKIFNIFYFSINFGAFFSGIITPYLLNHPSFGPAWAFGVPGLLMLIATILFWVGREKFVHIPPRPKMILDDLSDIGFYKLLGKLAILYVFVAVFWALFDQVGSSWIIQAKSNLMNKHINLGFFSFEILPSQIGTSNPIFVLLLIPLFTFVIYPFVNKYINFASLKKVNVGFFIASLSFFIVAYVESEIYHGNTVSVWWQILGVFILTIGEILISITVLEYSYSKAPNSLKSFIMSFYLFSVSLGNLFTSQVNKYMVKDFQPTTVEIQDESLFFTSSHDFQTGDKININQDLGLMVVNKQTQAKDTTFVTGTYIVKREGERNRVYDVKTREPLSVKLLKPTLPIIEKDSLSYYSLNGDKYFLFFAYLMLITAVVFIPFALKMKTKTYIQSRAEA